MTDSGVATLAAAPPKPEQGKRRCSHGAAFADHRPTRAYGRKNTQITVSSASVC
jgi:hypothetical protein